MNAASIALPAAGPALPLLERLRLAALARGDAAPTADTLVGWVRAYILFHDKRNPDGLGFGRDAFR
jgi:hypothetical protein